MANTVAAEFGDKLYDLMTTKIEDSDETAIRWFTQQDIVEMTSWQTNEVLQAITHLSSWWQVRSGKLGGQTCWTPRSKDTAKAIRVLSSEERMIFTYIEEAQERGIWVREIKRKANQNAAVVDKALKKLDSSNLIKGVKNVKHPMQKTYILYHLTPSVEVTGGTFFDAGMLDQSMIDELSNLIIYHVGQQSWGTRKVISNNAGKSKTANPPNNKRRRPTNDIEDAPPSKATKLAHPREREESFVPYAAGTGNYPSTDDILSWIQEVGVLRDKGAEMTVTDLQNVIDVLLWDDKLEKVGDGYRTVRGVEAQSPGSLRSAGGIETTRGKNHGLTQTPCWRCPVFDICETGGVVNADKCVYFDEWLGVTQ